MIKYQLHTLSINMYSNKNNCFLPVLKQYTVIKEKNKSKNKSKNRIKNKLHSKSSCSLYTYHTYQERDYYTNTLCTYLDQLYTGVHMHQSLNSRNQESTSGPGKRPWSRISHQQGITSSTHPWELYSKTRNPTSGPGEDHNTASISSRGHLSPLGTLVLHLQHLIFFSTLSAAPYLLQHLIFSTISMLLVGLVMGIFNRSRARSTS